MQDGGCLCRAIRYRVHGEPLRSGVCHCRSCRKAASSPTLPFVVFPVEGFDPSLVGACQTDLLRPLWLAPHLFR